MLRHFAGILLLVSLIAPFAATYSWLHYEKAVVRKAVKQQLMEGLDADALVLLTFSKADATTQIHWEHAREFEFEGEMYDVVSCDTVGEMLHYRCWHDHPETALNQQLNQLVAGRLEHNQEHHQSQQRLLGFYLALYYASTDSWLLSVPAPEYQLNVFCYSACQTTDAPRPLSPPPDCC